MTPESDPIHRGPSRDPRGLLAVVGVNLTLGIPGVVPVWLASVYLAQWPLDALGFTTREPTENDGVVVAFVVVLPVVILGALVWFLIGRWLWRRVHAVGARWFWLVSVLAVLFPSVALVLASLVL